MQIKKIVFSIFILYATLLSAQSNKNKVFWHQDFSSGSLPAGWHIPPAATWDPQWIVTNQPYPGSYKYQQQAPPIASVSRGYHLQFQAGYFTDEDVDNWVKRKQYPDGYIVSAPINCIGKKSVILQFQQKFRWWNYRQNDTAGLFVGVSTDSIHWQQWDVRHTVKSETDMFAPLTEAIDVSAVAANQPTVFLRFYWKGLMGFYWMVDDIALSEAYSQDVSVVRLLSHNEESNQFKKNDELVLKIKNSGGQNINTNFTVTANIDSQNILTLKVPAATNAFKPGEERDIVFPPTDLTLRPVHHISFKINYPGDEHTIDNTLNVQLNAAATFVGNITAIKKESTAFVFSSGVTKVRLQFYRGDIFRIWLAPDGSFTDPSAGDIVIAKPTLKSNIIFTDKGDYVLLQSKLCAVRVYKKPMRFAMYNAANRAVIWEEKQPLLFGQKTVQSLSARPGEYFYGCGMQNGYFSHRNKTILIEKGGGWDDGGRANPAPFYMSTSGYGVYRNTFDAGEYSFNDTLRLSHNENRFDAFYFYGPSLKNILNRYTDITGKPFLMPRWALSMGDANCYNKPGRDKKPQTTPDVIWKIADQYIAHEMPRGWILPNDGYGCGYVKLDSVVKALHERGFYTGLWTENGIDKIATEVGTYGTRLCKLDVAWVGPGYKYALDGCRAAYEGIENNSNARGFIWSVMGWAGTQRYSTVWSGDQYGGWEYIRFHIPTITGAGLSAQNAASSDIDGIFGGSDSTYTRDLQWKSFIPVLMTMSGWAKKDKQPWISGEPYTSINRKYLQLKMRLTPYMYTLCREANITGVPAARAMVLEFPSDSTTLGKQTQYQFMNGQWLLVAPVYKPGNERDSIYLPRGKWIDYWNGELFNGGKWLRHYAAPLEKLPVFVKAGAIIPMYQAMNFDAEKKPDTLTLDMYPEGKTAFNLYEDDGLTREYKKGAYATTLFEMNAGKIITVTINAVKGKYNGSIDRRSYHLIVHTSASPKTASLDGELLPQLTGERILHNEEGYYIDTTNGKTVLHIQTRKIATQKKHQVVVLND
ncbi:glycoside hydrolase family 31 protein [Ferruginibacter paludis]|uniref:glycoside hydrolase family 31 protein n=1 Tax=Ferruginibacter paludis TaxID=1310417 RepID=UPI0025B55CA5|nr:TIM-barrel domain-containing protein [Ferruginibacter paludis]MDN3656993.1 glycoside hydrolase family 31 protein [Ferruginibacter paludis]